MTEDLGNVAHFHLLEKLGEGGMGIVYRAEDTALGRTVALKVLPPASVGDDRAKRRLLREARAAAAVQHPNIASIFEVGEDAGRVYIAMELVEGVTLRSMLHGGRRLPVDEALRIAREVARGLLRAHDKGVIHRDIKPDNVMLDGQREVKILDFGLAKTRAADAGASGDEETVSQLTRDGEMVGTPAYMPPEQVLGDTRLDQRADVFSFGVMLYEMLAGVRPFRGATGAEVIAAVLRDDPDPPSKYASAAQGVDALVLRCLEKNPGARFASGRELLNALDALDVLRRRPAGDPIETTAGASTVSGPRVAPRSASSTPRWLTATALLVVVGGAAALVARARAYDATSESASSAPSSSVRAAAKRGVGILDLPSPPCNPAALLEYRAGLSAIRDIGWTASEPHFRAAAKSDPGCAAAHLRVAYLAQGYAPLMAREEFQRARSGREGLGERGLALMEALEPTLALEPPDTHEARRRLVALTTRFPDDAEVLTTAALASADDSLEAVGFARRAMAIDPGYADAYQAVARVNDRRGDIPASRQALDDCIRAAPAAIDCRFERANIDRRLGQCELMATHAREAIVLSPSTFWARPLLTTALASQGGERELVAEVLHPFWAQLGADDAYRAPHQRALIAALFGDFAVAAQELDALGRIADTREELAPHIAYALTRIALLTETGDPKGATRFADDLTRRIPAWSRPPLLGRNLWGLRVFEPQLAAAISEPTQRERLMMSWHDWLRHADMDRLAVWAAGEASFVTTPGGAQRALALTTIDKFSLPSRFSLVDGYVGHALLLGGREADAIPFLDAATQRCDAGEVPFEHTRAFLWLGQALEAAGDRQRACQAFAVVLRRWGAAKPASLTATLARERATKLACAK